MHSLLRGTLAAMALATALSACGPSSSSTVPIAPATSTPTAAATPSPSPAPGPVSVSATVGFSATASTTTLPTLKRATVATLTVPAATSSGTLAVTASTAFPANFPVLQLAPRSPSALHPRAGTYTTYFALEFVPSVATTLAAVPSFAVTFDAGDVPAGTALYVAYLTGNNGSPAWTTVAGPTTYTSGTFTFTGATAAQPLNSGQRYGLVVYAIGSGSPVGTPSASPAPSSSPSPGPSAAPTSSPSSSPTPAPALNPATVGAYVMGVDANGKELIRYIAPGAADYGRTLALDPKFYFQAIDTDAAGTVYIGGFSTSAGGATGSRIDRYPSGATTPASSVVLQGGGNVLAAASDGTVYFNLPGTIGYASPGATSPTTPLPASTYDTSGLALDKSGNVYAIQKTGQSFALVEYGPRLSGTARSVPLSVPAFGSANGLRVDGGGNAYVSILSGSSSVKNSIALIAAGSSAATYTTLPTGNPQSFAFDANDNVYVPIAATNDNTNNVSVYTPLLAALSRTFPAPTTDGAPTAVRVDPQGAIYLITGAGYSNGSLRIYPAGQSTPRVTTTTGITLPVAIALGN